MAAHVNTMKKRILAIVLAFAAAITGLGALSDTLTNDVLGELLVRHWRADNLRVMFGPLSPTAEAYYQGMADANLMAAELLWRANNTGSIAYVPPPPAAQ